MKQKEQVRGVDRRDLLKLAGLGGLAGAAAAVAAGDSKAATEQPKGKAGYRETDHVRTYYKLAKF